MREFTYNYLLSSAIMKKNTKEMRNVVRHIVAPDKYMLELITDAEQFDILYDNGMIIDTKYLSAYAIWVTDYKIFTLAKHIFNYVAAEGNYELLYKIAEMPTTIGMNCIKRAALTVVGQFVHSGEWGITKGVGLPIPSYIAETIKIIDNPDAIPRVLLVRVMSIQWHHTLEVILREMLQKYSSSEMHLILVSVDLYKDYETEELINFFRVWREILGVSREEFANNVLLVDETDPHRLIEICFGISELMSMVIVDSRSMLTVLNSRIKDFNIIMSIANDFSEYINDEIRECLWKHFKANISNHGRKSIIKLLKKIGLYERAMNHFGAYILNSKTIVSNKSPLCISFEHDHPIDKSFIEIITSDKFEEFGGFKYIGKVYYSLNPLIARKIRTIIQLFGPLFVGKHMFYDQKMQDEIHFNNGNYEAVNEFTDDMILTIPNDQLHRIEKKCKDNRLFIARKRQLDLLLIAASTGNYCDVTMNFILE